MRIFYSIPNIEDHAIMKAKMANDVIYGVYITIYEIQHNPKTGQEGHLFVFTT